MFRSPLFVGAFLLPTFVAFFLRHMDYNRLISIPYWTAFSYCYLAEEWGVESICSDAAAEARTQWLAENWRWELEDVPRDSDRPIPELSADAFSYEALSEVTKGFTVPAVVRGLLADTPATREWSSDYFKEQYGEDLLIVLSESRLGKQYAASSNGTCTAASCKGGVYNQIMAPRKMRLKNAIRRMEEGEKLYLANVDTIFRRHNELLDQLQLTERVKPWAYENYEPFAVQMFLGFGSDDRQETSGTMFHAAASANLFGQVCGNKTWSFISPRYSAFLRPSLGKSTPASKVQRKPSGVPRMHVTLQPGDVLINPPWQWHEIHNGRGFTVGVATRENHPPWIARNNMLFSGLLEWSATPRVARMVIPEEKFVLRSIAATPFLSFTLALARESILGPQKHPLFTAAHNFCDEHDRSGEECFSSVLDKAVYSADTNEIPYSE